MYWNNVVAQQRCWWPKLLLWDISCLTWFCYTGHSSITITPCVYNYELLIRLLWSLLTCYGMSLDSNKDLCCTTSCDWQTTIISGGLRCWWKSTVQSPPGPSVVYVEYVSCDHRLCLIVVMPEAAKSLRSLGKSQSHRIQYRDEHFLKSDNCNPIVSNQPCRLCFTVNMYFLLPGIWNQL